MKRTLRFRWSVPPSFRFVSPWYLSGTFSLTLFTSFVVFIIANPMLFVNTFSDILFLFFTFLHLYLLIAII